MIDLVWLIPALPLAGAALNLVVGRRLDLGTSDFLVHAAPVALAATSRAPRRRFDGSRISAPASGR